jgi:hypothetical protein
MSASMTFESFWNGEEETVKVNDVMDEVLAEWGSRVVAADKVTTRFKTGALRNSKRTAPPDYSGDDTEASRAGDLAAYSVEEVKGQIEDHQLAVGSWSSYSYIIETRYPSTVIAVDTVSEQLDQITAEVAERRGM